MIQPIVIGVKRLSDDAIQEQIKTCNKQISLLEEEAENNKNENMKPENISTIFPDSLTFSNMMLEGIGGDYDGDQVTIKGLYSQEANIEAEKIMNSLSYIININGENMRTSSKECIEGLYQLTRRA